MSDTRNKWYAFIIATLTAFMGSFSSSSVNIALPSIENEFNIDPIVLAWIVTSYILTISAMTIPGGRLSDIYGRKKLFVLGVAIYIIGSFLVTVSGSAAMLITFRVVQGIGGAIYFSPVIAILISAFPLNERGKALGANVAFVYLGHSLGPFLGGLLTGYLGWRSVFWVCIPIGLIAIIIAFWKIKGEWAEARGETFDSIGALLIVLMLALLIYGLSSLPSVTGWVCLTASVLFMLFFYRCEERQKYPLLDLDLFRRNISFTLFNLAALINYSATHAIAFLVSLYLQYNKGFSPQGAGLIMVSQPITQAIFSTVAGRISDSVKPHILSSSGMGIVAVGLILLSLLTENTGLVYIVGSLSLLGFGFAFFSSPNTNAIMSSVEGKYYGVASAIGATVRPVGMMLSMGIVMVIFSAYIGKVQITIEQHIHILQGMKIIYLVFAVISFVGIVTSLAGGRAAVRSSIIKD